ncbi:extracellular calcium-sensing receptor-like [Ambystoma mexicanum]|uniref:extracellular calcium-sensing receptor-like n=1 Tax=Ambystoma mexicanum TaxID=8296 RepID=UPI0037E8EAB9
MFPKKSGCQVSMDTSEISRVILATTERAGPKRFIRALHCQRAFVLLVSYLMQASALQNAVAECQLQTTEVSGFSSEGSVLIGGIFPAHNARPYEDVTFRKKPAAITCQTLILENYQWLQAMMFAMDEINGNPDLLPNITLGVQIYDSCRMPQRALEGTLWLLSGHQKPVLNYDCWSTRPPAAIIGDSTSTRAILMAHILGLYRYPQISYSASSPLLSDKNQFPSFLRTITSDDFQSRGLAQLVIHFGWTWVGLLAEDNDYGQQGIQILHEELVKSGACVAFSETIITNRADKNAFAIAQVIKKSTANAIVIFSTDYNLIFVLDELIRQNVTGKILIASEGWSTSTLLSREKYLEILTGTIGLESHSGDMPGFEGYLTSFQPSNYPDYIFINEFWEVTFGCKWLDPKMSPSLLDNKTAPCTGQEHRESQSSKKKEFTSVRFTSNIYSAIYAVALALHDLISCRPGGGPFYMGTCADTMDFKPWQLLHYLKSVHSQTEVEAEAFFDRDGNPPARYDIVNWQLSPQGTVRQVKVGTYEASAARGKHWVINTSTIQWTTGKTQVPTSVCSSSCPSGFRKAAKQGEAICCFQCVQCPPGEVSNYSDSVECFRCQWDQWPNDKQDRCIPKTIEYLTYSEPLGATLSTASIVSSMMPAAILALFIHYRDTPIVKANNSSLSFLLLLSLILCLLCSLFFIGYPTQEKCLLRQAAFGTTFALSVSCILSKTILVVIAFNAIKPNSKLRKWLGPQLSYTIIIVCTLIQVLLCVLWLHFAPPYSEYNTHIHLEKIIVECNEGSPVVFWCMLGYLGLMAIISFVVAFLARKLPDRFNETKFITFSMLAFLSVWLSFIPAYLSTKGKYMVAMEIFAIFSSSSSLVHCIFLPKCYIILFRSGNYSKDYRIGKGAGHANTF